MARLLVGTDDGLVILDEQGSSGWKIIGHFLKGREINGVVSDRASSSILVAARGEGLSRINPRESIVERLGQTILPEIVRTVTISPHDRDRIFVGTEPAGIYVSDNGGADWRELGAVAALRTEKRWKYPVPTIANHIRHILVDRENAELIFAAVQVGGIIRSENGGRDWSHVHEGLDPDVHTLLQHPVRAEVLFAVCGGGGYFPGEPEAPAAYPPPLPQGRPIYRSVDRGLSWTCISTGFSRTYGVPLHVAPGKSPKLYAAVADSIPPFWAKRASKADATVIMSHDDGDTWSPVTQGLPTSFPDMIEVITANPREPERMFLGTGGEGMKMLPPEERIGRVFSTDSTGTTWSEIPIHLRSIFALTVV